MFWSYLNKVIIIFFSIIIQEVEPLWSATATCNGVPVDHNGHAQSFKAQQNKNGHKEGNFTWR